MAAVVNGAAVGSTTGAATYNSGSFTPAVGDLLVAFVGVTGETSADWAVTDNQSGTWTKIRRQVKNASADIFEVWVRDQLVSSAVGHTVTYSHAVGNATGGVVGVVRVSGMTNTGSAAVRSQGGQDNQATGTTPAPVLDSTPLTTNPILTAVHNGQNPGATTQRTGYTVRHSTGYGTPTTGLRTTSLDSGETSATLTWGGTSTGAWSSIGIELDASAGEPGPAGRRRDRAQPALVQL